MAIKLSSRIQDYVGIKYKLESSDNLNEFMKAIGVSAMKRKFGKVNSTEETFELNEEDGKLTFTTIIKSKTCVSKFKLGEEFEEKTLDGRKVKSIITQQGSNKLVELQKGEKRTCEIVREFAKDKLVVTYTVDDVQATKTYSVLSAPTN